MTTRIILAAAVPLLAFLPACQTSDTRFSSTDQSSLNRDQSQAQYQNPNSNPNLNSNPNSNLDQGPVDQSRNPAASNSNTGENIQPGDRQGGMATEGR
jgi:hypothetical protein